MKQNKGFSLIEVLIVLALIGTITALAIWNTQSLYRLTVRADIEKLYTTCLYLQQKALSCQEKQTLYFALDKKTYRYENCAERLNTQVLYGFIAGAKGPPSSPHVLITQENSFENNQIVFYPDGVIQAGTLYLTDVNKRVLYALTSGVGQVSFLRKYYYDGSWHLL